MSSRNRLIDELDLVRFAGQIGRDELCHFNVVGEDVEWKIKTLSNGYKFLLMIVVFSRFVVHVKLRVSECTSIKGSKWLNKFA